MSLTDAAALGTVFGTVLARLSNGQLALVLLAFVSVYLLPIILALVRRHPQVPAVTICTLLGPFTGFGWVLALAYACWRFPADAPPPPPSPRWQIGTPNP